MAPENKFPKRSRRIKYLCQPWPGTTRKAGVGATTYTAIWDEAAPGPSTVFCPLFFDKGPKGPGTGYQYIQDIAKTKTWSPTDLPQVNAREHAIIHEMCHVDAATGRTSHSHITDLKSTLPNEDGVVPIYGASRTHNFAWKNAYTGPQDARTVNPDTYVSMDNFDRLVVRRPFWGVVKARQPFIGRWLSP